MKKVNGYTLIDVLFAMAFIVTVVAMATMAYSYLIRHNLTLLKSKTAIQQNSSAYIRLKEDIWQSDSIFVQSDHLKLYRDTIRIQYTFDRHIVRKQNTRTDTLPFGLQKVEKRDRNIRLNYTLLGEDFETLIKEKQYTSNEVNAHMQILVNGHF